MHAENDNETTQLKAQIKECGTIRYGRWDCDFVQRPHRLSSRCHDSMCPAIEIPSAKIAHELLRELDPENQLQKCRNQYQGQPEHRAEGQEVSHG